MPKHHRYGIAATRLNLSENKIKRAPALKFRIVPCPDCGAQIGEPCLAPNGNIITKGHISRHRLAVRKLLDEGESGEQT